MAVKVPAGRSLLPPGARQGIVAAMSDAPLPPAAQNVAPPTLGQACDILGTMMSPKPGPVVLHQYWDRDPPEQIRQLLDHNARLCREWGIGHDVWDRPRAERFLAAHMPENLALFRAAPHPAMASDLLRLCLVEVHGGLYLDADMGLNPAGGAQLPALLHQVLLFKWGGPDRQNTPNWCFGFRSGHPMLRHIRMETARAMDAAIARDPAAAMKAILRVSGPGRFTLAAAHWLALHGCPPGLLLLDVAQTGSLVVNGPQILKRPLAYKKTSTHWLVAAQQAAPE